MRKLQLAGIAAALLMGNVGMETGYCETKTDSPPEPPSPETMKEIRAEKARFERRLPKPRYEKQKSASLQRLLRK